MQKYQHLTAERAEIGILYRSKEGHLLTVVKRPGKVVQTEFGPKAIGGIGRRWVLLTDPDLNFLGAKSYLPRDTVVTVCKYMEE